MMSADMNEITGDRSSSSVFIADNFRDNLIVDRYDPCFAAMGASKLKHLVRSRKPVNSIIKGPLKDSCAQFFRSNNVCINNEISY